MTLAISVRQPWAWAIIHGGKDVEKRSRVAVWRRAEGQRVAIHAGLTLSERGAQDDRIIEAAEHRVMVDGATLDGDAAVIAFGAYSLGNVTRGAIIGTAHCYDVHQAERGCCDSPWAEYTYRDAYGHTVRNDIAHLILDDPQPCEPIPCRGALGLWTVPADVAEQLGAVRR
jgi:hypothetical protein